MPRIRIAGETFEFASASLVAYHCDGPEADWNLALDRDGDTLWLAGTVTPGPRSPDALVGAVVTVDLRALDEVVGALLGRHVTLYPGGQDVCALAFPLARGAAGVRLAAAVACDWDRALETFPGASLVEMELDIDAVVAELHPGDLP